ncbi:MAG: hypothetical protein CBC74_006870 [Crocinitomicaceae bacterium TMED114]|nr:MAG: hypothetical protein CBC74_006870 [Crocinitomicaceae bacterium TMED114]
MGKKVKPRRMAIQAEWQRDSESAPGFNKYFITIREVDGTEVRVPVYGRDMQDALNRITKRERTEKFVETTERIPDFVYVLLFLGTLGIGATLSTTADNPLYFAVGAGALVVLVGLYLLRTRQ